MSPAEETEHLRSRSQPEPATEWTARQLTVTISRLQRIIQASRGGVTIAERSRHRTDEPKGAAERIRGPGGTARHRGAVTGTVA